MNVLPTAAAEFATAVAKAYGAPRKLCGPKTFATVSAAVYTTDAATTPTSDTSPTTSLGLGSLIGADVCGATGSALAAVGCRDAIFAVVTALEGAAFSGADGFGSSANGFEDFAGFEGFDDATVRCARRGFWRVCGLGAASESAADVNSGAVAVAVWSGAVSVSVSALSAFGSGFFDSFAAFLCGAAELAELDASAEGDGLSAHAIPLPTPTTTQADNRNAATANRNHQCTHDFADNSHTSRPAGMQCIQPTAAVVPV